MYYVIVFFRIFNENGYLRSTRCVGYGKDDIIECELINDRIVFRKNGQQV